MSLNNKNDLDHLHEKYIDQENRMKQIKSTVKNIFVINTNLKCLAQEYEKNINNIKSKFEIKLEENMAESIVLGLCLAIILPFIVYTNEMSRENFILFQFFSGYILVFFMIIRRYNHYSNPNNDFNEAIEINLYNNKKNINNLKKTIHNLEKIKDKSVELFLEQI